MTPKDIIQQDLRDAYQLAGEGKPDAGIAKIGEALKIDPQSLNCYILRGTLYSQQKMWDKAEADFNTALQIDPAGSVIKFDLAEIKFVQKQYDLARAGFAALQPDPDLGDLAKYKTFLCDLFGGHDTQASDELAAFNQAGSNPSYYFSNAAWSLYHRKTEDARGWLTSAQNIYSPQKNSYYAASLRDLGYLPLPAPPATGAP